MTKRVRKAVFSARSALPTSAACVVANGVRETLGSLLGTPVDLHLFEPAVPRLAAWTAILRQAVLYRVRGGVTDAAIVLRDPDARALISALFGENLDERGDRALSRIERDVLDRTARAIAAHLGAVCGTRDNYGAEPVETFDEPATYFEIALVEPLAARIGVALARDPNPEPGVRFDIGHLGAVPLAARAALDLGRVSSGSVARLAPGTVLPIAANAMQRCTLGLYGRCIARGGCGVRNGRYAFTVSELGERDAF